MHEQPQIGLAAVACDDLHPTGSGNAIVHTEKYIKMLSNLCIQGPLVSRNWDCACNTLTGSFSAYPFWSYYCFITTLPTHPLIILLDCSFRLNSFITLTSGGEMLSLTTQGSVRLFYCIVLVELMLRCQVNEDACTFRIVDSLLTSLTLNVVKLGNFGVKT